MAMEASEAPGKPHSRDPNKARASKRHARWTVAGIEFFALYVFWILLSGHLQTKFLLIGAGAAALVTYLTNDLLLSDRRSARHDVWDVKFTLFCAFRLLRYSAWLVVAIVKANIQVASIVLKPRMKVDPGLLQFETQLRRNVSRVTMANSITLTPGTITVEQKNGKYIVHALVREAAGDIETGLMQDKVRAVFSDRKGQPPVCVWAHSRKELEV